MYRLKSCSNWRMMTLISCIKTMKIGWQWVVNTIYEISYDIRSFTSRSRCMMIHKLRQQLRTLLKSSNPSWPSYKRKLNKKLWRKLPRRLRQVITRYWRLLCNHHLPPVYAATVTSLIHRICKFFFFFHVSITCWSFTYATFQLFSLQRGDFMRELQIINQSWTRFISKQEQSPSSVRLWLLWSSDHWYQTFLYNM